MSIHQDSRYFRTSNFYTACFLFSKEMELANIDRSDSKRCQFVFVDTAEREGLIQAFSFAKDNEQSVLVDVRRFVMAIKMLKDKLYQNTR